MHRREDIHAQIQALTRELAKHRREQVAVRARLEGLDTYGARLIMDLAKLQIRMDSLPPYDPRLSEHWAA